MEERVRAALTARAASIEPSSDALTRIEEELMNEDPSTTTRNRWIIGGLSAAAAVLLERSDADGTSLLLLRRAVEAVMLPRKFKGVDVVIDVDPLNIL